MPSLDTNTTSLASHSARAPHPTAPRSLPDHPAATPAPPQRHPSPVDPRTTTTTPELDPHPVIQANPTTPLALTKDIRAPADNALKQAILDKDHPAQDKDQPVLHQVVSLANLAPATPDKITLVSPDSLVVPPASLVLLVSGQVDPHLVLMTPELTKVETIPLFLENPTKTTPSLLKYLKHRSDATPKRTPDTTLMLKPAVKCSMSALTTEHMISFAPTGPFSPNKYLYACGGTNSTVTPHLACLVSTLTFTTTL